jgi:hypothetical protein
MEEVIYIGCDFNMMCKNYKKCCGKCCKNWEIKPEAREELEDHLELYDE